MKRIKSIFSINSTLNKVQEELDLFKKEMNDSIVNNNKKIDSLIKTVTEIKEIKIKQEKEFINFSENAMLIGESFKKELERFRNLKIQLQSEFLARGEKELSNHLLNQSKRIKITTDEYTDLKENLIELAKTVIPLKKSIDSLSEIIKSIKKEDFKFNKVIENIKMSESERNDLLRKIDSLERLVATRRRFKSSK